VTPSELRAHRLSHQFLGPCCLCPSRPEEQRAFMEAAIFVVTSGRVSGEYVAGCAQGNCGYFGKLLMHLSNLYLATQTPAQVYMERIHNKIGVPVKAYPPRGKAPDSINNPISSIICS
jgi:hypothetical protein